MIDVAHDRDDRGARHEIVLVVGLLADSLLHLGADILRGESELVGHEVDGLGVETLVDGDHDAHRHECGDDFRHRHIHHRGQFRYGHKLRQFQRLALLALGACLLVELLLGSVALLLAVFGTLLVLGLRGEACQGLLDLACYGLVIDLQRFVAASAVLLLALSATVGLALLLLLALLLALLGGLLVGSGIDIDALLVDAYALLLALSVFLLALLASLLLALLLRARVLVDGAEVEFAEHVELRLVEQLLLVLCLEGCAALCRGGLLLLVLLLGGLSLGCRCGLCLLALGGLGGFLLRLHGLGCGLGLLLVFLLSVLLLGRGLLGHLLVGSLLRLLLHGRLLGLRFCLVLGCCLLLCGLRLLLLGLLWLLLAYGLLLLGLGLVCLWLLVGLLSRLAVELVKVDLAQRRIGLYLRQAVVATLHASLGLLLLAALFRLLGDGLHLLILVKLCGQGLILRIAELEVGVALHFAQIRLLLQKFHSRLEPDVQLSNCFV